MMIDPITIDDRKGIKRHSFLNSKISDSNFRSPEKETPLPEEETVQFNPADVVLDFCK